MVTGAEISVLPPTGIERRNNTQRPVLLAGPLTGGTFGTGPGIFREPEILRMPRVKIGIGLQVCKGNSGLDEGVKRHLDDDAKIMITKYPYNFCNFCRSGSVV